MPPSLMVATLPPATLEVMEGRRLLKVWGRTLREKPPEMSMVGVECDVSTTLALVGSVAPPALTAAVYSLKLCIDVGGVGVGVGVGVGAGGVGAGVVLVGGVGVGDGVDAADE